MIFPLKKGLNLKWEACIFYWGFFELTAGWIWTFKIL